MAQEKMTLEDWLDDLCVRFIINLPREDLSSVARICFQIEEAQWFYEDFIRPLDPSLPTMSLRTFSMKMFQHCPLLASFSADTHIKAFEEFMQYKTRVPVRGAIMLNDAMDAAVLVRGFKKGASWTFPRGKINKDEDDLDCAVREVYEETGYDLRASGLVEKNAPVQPFEVTMHDQQVRLYVFRGIPENTIFETRTRKEIGGIKWYKLSDLPTYKKKRAGKGQGPATTSPEKFYMVASFMAQLRQWVQKQQQADAQNTLAYAEHKHPITPYDENLTDDNMLHELPAPPSSNTHPENINSATRELHRLLQIKPPTQGLQLQTATSNQQAGQALLSKLSNTASVPSQGYGQPHTPYDHGTANAPHPLASHHQSQRIPIPDAPAPSSFPTDYNTGPDYSYHQQYVQRPRPQVFVTDNIPQASHRIEKPAVQLLHPQPLPPQVQKEMLLRDLRESAATPYLVNAMNHHKTTNLTQSFHAGPPDTQPHPFTQQGAGSHASQPLQLPAHTTNLLNVLRGNNPPIPAPQKFVPSHSSPLTNSLRARLDGQNQDRRYVASETGFPNQYGASNLPPTTTSATINAPASFSRNSSHAVPPTDQHRASLLGMFKTSQSTVLQSQIDGQSSPFLANVPRTDTADSQKQQRMMPEPPMADSMKSTTRENSHSQQRNPEHNLPYGAHSILRRGASGGPTGSPSFSTRNPNEATMHLPVRSHASPASSRGQMSPRRQMSPRGQLPAAARGQMSPYQGYLTAKVQQSPKQAAAQSQSHSASSYPYGNNPGSTSSPLTQFQTAPAASTLPIPSIAKPRQNSTVEQRNVLLSILTTSQPEGTKGKGQEVVGSKHTTAGSRPASRPEAVPFTSQGSRRGSATSLSAADRNFLLGFLENATTKTKD